MCNDESDPRRECPRCGSTRQAQFVYGLVEQDPAFAAKLQAGIVRLGGSSLGGDEPEWFCWDCKNRWGLSRQAQFSIEQAAAETRRRQERTVGPSDGVG